MSRVKERPSCATTRVLLILCRPAPSLTKDGLTNRDHLQLEVTDTGCGMSPETQAKVFDPFFTTKSAGRGLGLAVVHGTVRDLGGTIRISSEPDKGTTFQVLLPLGKTSAGAPVNESPPKV